MNIGCVGLRAGLELVWTQRLDKKPFVFAED
jgi:hypothetical protein